MPPIHTEVGIMIAILCSAWLLKVVGVALYIAWARRRMERQQRSGAAAGAWVGSSGVPTPQHVIDALPVLPFAKARTSGRSQSGSDDAATAGKQPAAPGAVALTAAAVAQPGQAVPPPPQPPQPQEQQAQQQQAQQQPGCTGSSCGADPCAICFEDFKSDDDVKQLPCSHFFHPGCITEWLLRDSTCPLCKAPVWAGGSSPEPQAGEQPSSEEAGGSSHAIAATLRLNPQQQLVLLLQRQQQVAVGPGVALHEVVVVPRR